MEKVKEIQEKINELIVESFKAGFNQGFGVAMELDKLGNEVIFDDIQEICG